ncbi:unnamed protein product, partial [Ixodes hexagonus]
RFTGSAAPRRKASDAPRGTLSARQEGGRFLLQNGFLLPPNCLLLLPAALGNLEGRTSARRELSAVPLPTGPARGGGGGATPPAGGSHCLGVSPTEPHDRRVPPPAPTHRWTPQPLPAMGSMNPSLLTK